MTITIRKNLAVAALALAVAATPLAVSFQSGLQDMTAAAREKESGGKHAQAGDDHGGRKGGKKGGTHTGDDHPENHSQNGKNRK